MKKFSLLVLTICVIFLFVSLLPVHGESDIYQNVLRLHVLANSNSDEDQALKLNVRDAIIDVCRPIFEECSSKEEAVYAIQNNLNMIQNTAKKIILEQGYDYSVSLELGEEEYPTRNYESFCFPAGRYVSLRVLIGEGEGENWWCVLFPPLCLSAASAGSDDDAIVVGLTKDQYSIIAETDTPAYSARFKILEVFEKALN